MSEIIFNILKEYSSNYVFVKAFNVVRKDDEGVFYFVDNWDETNIIPMTCFLLESFIDAFNDLKIEFKNEGCYLFEVLLKFKKNEGDSYSDECEIEHLEYKIESSIDQYDDFILNINDFGDDIELPF